MSDGRIVIDTEIDNSGAEQGISKLSNVASSGLKGVTTVVAGTVTAILEFQAGTGMGNK